MSFRTGHSPNAFATIFMRRRSSPNSRSIRTTNLLERLFGAGAAGARGMLATIAGSMMTAVGITFSMTLTTRALAANQYTSRILRDFMSDHITQVVLGISTGIFTYCLVVLRTIRGSDAGEFIPSLAVSFGVVLAIGGIGVLCQNSADLYTARQ